MRSVLLHILMCALVAVPGPGGARAAQELPEESAPQAPADEPWLRHRFELLDEVTLNRAAGSLFNPGGSLYELERRNNALRLHAQLGAQLPAGVSVQAQLTSAVRSGDETVTTLAVRELYATASLGDLELSVGRKILRWTNGFAFNPAGLLEPLRSPSDPQDRLRLLEGREVAQLDYFLGDHVLTAAFSSDVLTNDDADTRRYELALRANVLVPSWNLDLAVQALVSNVRNTGALTFTYALGEALEVHGEVAGTRGTSAEYPQTILPGFQRTLLGFDYLGQIKANETRLFLRYVLGVSYTLPWGTNLIGEFSHSDEGLSSQEWTRFLEQVDFSLEQRARGTYPTGYGDLSLPELNLLHGLQQLGRQRMRRNYLFLRASQAWMAERLQGNALALVNVDDLSRVLVGEVSYLVLRGATVYARGSLFSGSGRSEYGNVGQRASLNLGVLLSF
ncbi:hypothetical protein LZ198_40985 [Myxococcus sp. K15C18031901]|uniref:hypothetical protein n=1 Tax=Myxococcus dinghuensis TaxID=2906761 RepID=UPI0020A768E0|nr:hypothetical protein [Myxococcus dinghuensis]MCP3105263.1 hypothetical protein [Myxococcus dinghuensis]